MVYLLAVGAAFANALTTVLQRLGVEDAPPSTTLRWNLIAFAVRRKVWLVGFGVMTGSFFLQAGALRLGTLTEVEPVLTLELPMLVALLAFGFGQVLSWREWAGSCATAGGLAAFLVLAAPSAGGRVPGRSAWLQVAVSAVGVTAVAVVLTRFASPAWRAALFGMAAAVMFSLTASFIKQVTTEASHRWVGVVSHWEVYAMAGAGLVAVFLAQNAFHAGPVTASQTMLVVTQPLGSIAIGIHLFGDRVDTATARLVWEAIAVAVLCGGAATLARSPLVSSMHQASGLGPHDAANPALRRAWRTRGAR